MRTRLDGGRVIIEVEDRGIGIRQEHLEDVFEPLFSTKTAGLGLGLPNVKRIVEAHCGGITLTSTLGEGTCVRLSLPM